jgi:phage shock protein PspC (stress-responsive transcriptional regulator)
MQKVITINLNGNAYQLDETGYEALQEYLAGAERALAANPDRREIIADLEQAIADKCAKFLSASKTVVTATEVEQIVKEMGPIEAPTEETSGEGATSAGSSELADKERTMKRLYRIPDGAMIAGVCNGLAAYFAVDVTIVRVLFALTAFFTKGAGFILYAIMMFVVPEARTPEEQASAGGVPFNAKDVLDRAKTQYAAGRKEWRRKWREQRRAWRRQGWAPGIPPLHFAPTPWSAPMMPLFALAHLALVVMLGATVISLVNTGAVLGWTLPPGVPMWAGIIILFIGYQIVVSPIRVMERWSWQMRGPVAGPDAYWMSAVWLIGMAAAVWFASNHIPEIREFIQRLPPLVQQFAEAVRRAFAH